jgi:hypothetical protein
MTAGKNCRLDKLDFSWGKRRKLSAKSQPRNDESWREMYGTREIESMQEEA